MDASAALHAQRSIWLEAPQRQGSQVQPPTLEQVHFSQAPASLQQSHTAQSQPSWHAHTERDIEGSRRSSASHAHGSIWQTAPQRHGAQAQPSRLEQVQASTTPHEQSWQSQIGRPLSQRQLHAVQAHPSWQELPSQLQVLASTAVVTSLSFRLAVSLMMFISSFSLLPF